MQRLLLLLLLRVVEVEELLHLWVLYHWQFCGPAEGCLWRLCSSAKGLWRLEQRHLGCLLPPFLDAAGVKPQQRGHHGLEDGGRLWLWGGAKGWRHGPHHGQHSVSCCLSTVRCCLRCHHLW